MQSVFRQPAKNRCPDGTKDEGRSSSLISRVGAGLNEPCEALQEARALPGEADHPNRAMVDTHSGSGEEIIQFAIRRSSLGLILIASSIKGICAILLGDQEKALTADLRRRFPKAKRIANQSGLEEVAAEVVRAVEAPGSTLDLPLDLRGTEFQQHVWEALREIPAGSIATYKEIVQKVGSFKTAQEVAEACGANPLAVIVPCHRVIRSDGSLAGYRWGLKRKQALLEREQEAVPEPGSLFGQTSR
jgi:AraC family transcriptional regulator of adaptative response/methylated-DNA-[protein]-cysteine methyltransferase